MPVDNKGKFHINSQQSSSADKMSAPAPLPGEADKAPSGGVPEHLKAMHAEMGGKHMHVHSDGLQTTSHQIGDSGEVEGPTDHADLEALKEHMGRFFDEEEAEQESTPEQQGGSKESKDHASLYL